MKRTFYTNVLRLWAEGLVLLVLRGLELGTGFDPATGLSRHSVPGAILPAAIIILAAVEIFLAWRLPRGKQSYHSVFSPIGQKALPFLAAGSLLLCAGGFFPGGWSALSAAAAAAGAASAVGFLLFARQVRGGGEPRTYYLLPSMAFSVLFVLSVYLPQSSNPVLGQYYLPVLAASLTACAFYQLAGFPCREASLRWFLFFGDLSVPLCLACLAGSFENWGQALICAGCAVILSVFLSLRRQVPLPEPEERDGEPVLE